MRPGGCGLENSALTAASTSVLPMRTRADPKASGSAATSGANDLRNAAKACGLPMQYLPVDDPHARGLWERDLVLVRPDQHVAWRGNAAPADAQALMDQVRGMV